MRFILSFLFSLQVINIFSQSKFKFDNSLAGIVSNTQASSYGINFAGNNSFEYKKFNFTSSTNYNNRFNKQLVENELLQRFNLEYEPDKWNSFISYQYNYSLIRKIDFDGIVGIGAGVKITKIKDTKISISYATIYQNSIFDSGESTFNWRHSFRTKLRMERKLFNITFEYFYQPNMVDFTDYIVIGQTKLTLFANKPFNLVIQDVINYRSISSVKMIHNLTIGAGWKKEIKTN